MSREFITPPLGCGWTAKTKRYGRPFLTWVLLQAITPCHSGLITQDYLYVVHAVVYQELTVETS